LDLSKHLLTSIISLVRKENAMTEPIPLSAGFERRPSREHVTAALAAVRAVVAPTGAWPDGARGLVDAVLWKTEHHLDPAAIAPATLVETAAAILEPALRVQLVRLAIVATLLDGRPALATTERIEALAAALDVRTPELVDLRLLAEGRIFRLRRHLVPRLWVFSIIRAHARAHGWWSVIRMFAVMLRLAVDRRVQARFLALDQLPPGSLGPALLAFWRNAGFGLPGERGAPPWLVCYHDISHVLAGYGTDPRSEVQAGCFQGGYQRSDGFPLVLFVLCQFHLGIRMTPIARGEVGMVDPFRALDAVCRGAGMTRDLTDGTWDPWAHMAEDVEVLRSRYHLAPPAWPA
jgi:hypothetical protein